MCRVSIGEEKKGGKVRAKIETRETYRMGSLFDSWPRTGLTGEIICRKQA